MNSFSHKKLEIIEKYGDILRKNLELLKFNDFLKNNDLELVLTDDLFESSNRYAFQLIMYHLFELYDRKETLKKFELCWPIFDARQAKEFSQISRQWVVDIDKHEFQLYEFKLFKGEFEVHIFWLFMKAFKTYTGNYLGTIKKLSLYLKKAKEFNYAKLEPITMSIFVCPTGFKVVRFLARFSRFVLIHLLTLNDRSMDLGKGGVESSTNLMQDCGFRQYLDTTLYSHGKNNNELPQTFQSSTPQNTRKKLLSQDTSSDLTLLPHYRPIPMTLQDLKTQLHQLMSKQANAKENFQTILEHKNNELATNLNKLNHEIIVSRQLDPIDANNTLTELQVSLRKMNQSIQGYKSKYGDQVEALNNLTKRINDGFVSLKSMRSLDGYKDILKANELVNSIQHKPNIDLVEVSTKYLTLCQKNYQDLHHLKSSQLFSSSYDWANSQETYSVLQEKLKVMKSKLALMPTNDDLLKEIYALMGRVENKIPNNLGLVTHIERLNNLTSQSNDNTNTSSYQFQDDFVKQICHEYVGHIKPTPCISNKVTSSITKPQDFNVKKPFCGDTKMVSYTKAKLEDLTNNKDETKVKLTSQIPTTAQKRSDLKSEYISLRKTTKPLIQMEIPKKLTKRSINNNDNIKNKPVLNGNIDDSRTNKHPNASSDVRNDKCKNITKSSQEQTLIGSSAKKIPLSSDKVLGESYRNGSHAIKLKEQNGPLPSNTQITIMNMSNNGNNNMIISTESNILDNLPVFDACSSQINADLCDLSEGEKSLSDQLICNLSMPNISIIEE